MGSNQCYLSTPLISTQYVILLLLFFTSSVLGETRNDFSRLNPIVVRKVIPISNYEDIVKGLHLAEANNLNLAISAKRNSQGGHTAVFNGVVLDTSEYNKVVNFSETQKTITVQTGITWAEIQEYINPYKLSIKVMQSSNIFSVGGSISSNIHGRDPRFGTIVETIQSFTIVLSDGHIYTASRTENSDLFFAAIGGYGVIGFIAEVTLQLTDNKLLKKSVESIVYDQYPDHIQSNVSDSLSLHYGRCSIERNDDFFRECIVVNYSELNQSLASDPLQEEQNITRDTWLFAWSRKYDWGKSIRWWLQGLLVDKPGEEIILSRNNAMRPSIKFLQYESEDNTDILQEYFIPIEQFVSFMDELRQILITNEVNVLSMTLRYVPKSEDVFLNYAHTDSIAIVLYINVGTNDKSQNQVKKWTREIVDTTIEHHGKYYLTYQRYPSIQQFKSTYPTWKKFKEIKDKYDPLNIFSNEFYKQYFLGKENNI